MKLNADDVVKPAIKTQMRTQYLFEVAYRLGIIPFHYFPSMGAFSRCAERVTK